MKPKCSLLIDNKAILPITYIGGMLVLSTKHIWEVNKRLLLNEIK